MTTVYTISLRDKEALLLLNGSNKAAQSALTDARAALHKASAAADEALTAFNERSHKVIREFTRYEHATIDHTCSYVVSLL